MLTSNDKISIPYSAKTDLKVIKDLGKNLIDQILEDNVAPYCDKEIHLNYKKRMMHFFSNIIHGLKENMVFSKTLDETLKPKVEYKERDESLPVHNDKLLADLHMVLE